MRKTKELLDQQVDEMKARRITESQDLSSTELQLNSSLLKKVETDPIIRARLHVGLARFTVLCNSVINTRDVPSVLACNVGATGKNEPASQCKWWRLLKEALLMPAVGLRPFPFDSICFFSHNICYSFDEMFRQDVCRFSICISSSHLVIGR